MKDGRPETPEEERATLIHCARVYLAEARRRRHQPKFAATLTQWAANCRRDAQAIDISPAQGVLL